MNENYLIAFRRQTILQKPKFLYHIQEVNCRDKKMIRFWNHLQDPFRTLKVLLNVKELSDQNFKAQ